MASLARRGLGKPGEHPLLRLRGHGERLHLQSHLDVAEGVRHGAQLPPLRTLQPFLQSERSAGATRNTYPVSPAHELGPGSG